MEQQNCTCTWPLVKWVGGKSRNLKSLLKFYENVSRKPKFMCIIVGHYEAVVQDKETGIYIVPITSLKP